MCNTFKQKLMFVLCSLCTVLLFTVSSVSAADIENNESLKQTFENTKSEITDNTVTLTQDTTVDDVVNVMGDFTLNLNGHKLALAELYAVEGTLTINDTTGKGSIVSNFIGVEADGELIINNGTFEFIDNMGKMTVNGGTITTLFNTEGTLVIEDGTISALMQAGKATINGGKFVADKFNDGEGEVERFTAFDLQYGTTVINGGEFTSTENIDFAVVLYGGEDGIKESDIQTLFAPGYEASYDKYYTTDGYTGFYGKNVKVADASVNFSDVFKKITSTSTWEVNSFVPKNAGDSEFLLSAIIADIVNPLGYEGYGMCDSEPFNPEIATIYLYNSEGQLAEQHTVKVKYILPEEEATEEVNTAISNMKDYKTTNDMNEKNAYRLEDLNLINFLNASNGDFDAKALNFCSELIEATGGSNISFKFDGRAGDAGALHTFAMGQAIVYYDDVAFTTKNAAVTASHVIYIPSNTENTDEAYINAATKRIKDYLGDDAKISIKVGGTLESLNYYDEYAEREITFNEYGFLDEKTCGSNYYDLTLNDATYRFAICKKDDAELKAPTYLGSDVETNISITSENTKIPLDTALKVENIKSEKIESSVGTTNYAAFDISLYSKTKETNITKLDEGKFEVSIPMPSHLKDKDITVYYVADDGSKEECVPKIENNFVTFETNHFSTYVIAEKVKETPKPEENNKQEDKGEKDDTPNTGYNNIIDYVIASTAVAGIALTLLKRKI